MMPETNNRFSCIRAAATADGGAVCKFLSALSAISMFSGVAWVGLLAQLSLPVSAANLTYSGSFWATDQFLPPDPRAQVWYASSATHTNVYAYQTLANGAWALVEGGMGTVTHRLAENARRAGASLFRARRVASIDTFGG